MNPFNVVGQQLSPTDSIYRANLPDARRLDSIAQLARLAEEARLMDPALKRVPTERLDQALQQLAERQKNGSTNVGVPNVLWTERGPSGYAVRVRTMLVDPNDPTGKKVWAGSEVGGLWYTPDITSASVSWSVVSDTWQNRNISALAADPSNPQVMYAGTGEMVDNYFSQNGGGIWKTTNGGATWQRLSSTIPASSPTLQSAFWGISKLVVNSTGTLFAATRSGIIRSTDGGTSWAFVLAPQQSIGGTPVSGGDDGMSDLEMGSDGVLYAATRTGRLFRANSTAGTAWTEISPPNTSPYNNIRTELALAPSTSGGGQVVYATGIYSGPDWQKDVKWFLKSTDAGATWVAMNRPIVNSNNPTDQDFTWGSGRSTLRMAVSPTDANQLYVGGYYYLYNSTDGGQTWTPPNFFDRLTALLVTGQSILWASIYNGISYAPLPYNSSVYYSDSRYRRNKGFSSLPSASASLRNVPGNPTILSIIENDFGMTEQLRAGLTEGGLVNGTVGRQTFVDQNEPNILIGGGTYGSFSIRNTNLTDSWNWNYVSYTNNYGPNPAVDYDSRSNTMYIWNNGYYKITNVGSQNTASAWSGLSMGRASAVRVGAEENTVYVAIEPYTGGVQSPQLYRITNAHTNTPIIGRIDGGAFPAGAYINHIEVGVTDNALLVTTSNYGVKSVWFSSNLGASWNSKDEATHGLPDVPVYGAVFNPNNNNQVMLATELGIWSTTDITATNPGWESSSTGLPLIRVNQVRSRRSDGRIIAATNGRGVWESLAWEVPHTPATLAVGPLSSTVLCANSLVPVSFTLNNATSGRFVVYMSDSTGSFINRIQIGSGTASPVMVTIPYVSYTGTGYRIIVEAAEPSLATVSSQTLTISNLSTRWIRVMDRRNFIDSYMRTFGWSNNICSGQTAVLRAGYDNNGNAYAPNATFAWALNGVVLSGQTSATLPATQAGTYSYTVSDGGCMVPSNSYNLSVNNSNTPYVINFSSGPICAGLSMNIGATTLAEAGVYQWYRDGVTIPGATSFSLAVTQTGLYSFSVSEGSCTPSLSQSALIRFDSVIFPSTIHSSGTGNPVLCGGNSIEMYLSGSLPYKTTFQWLKDGQPIPNTNSRSFYAVSEPGVYSVRYQQGNCSATSSPISVSTGTTRPLTISHTDNLTLCAGGSRYLSSNYWYSNQQWMKDGVDIPGATNAYIYATASGVYTVRITNISCPSSSQSVSLTFSNQVRPEIRISGDYCTGAYLVPAEYPTPFPNQFSWYRNGTLVYQGSSQSYYATTPGTYSFSANYGSSCIAQSSGYVYTPGTIQSSPILANNASTCEGSAALLYSTSNTPSYWKWDGVQIPNSTNQYNWYPTQSGRYTTVYQSGTCVAESDPIDVTIGAPVSGTLAGRAVVPAGQPGTLLVGLSGAAPWSFTLSNGQAFTNVMQNPYSFTLSPTATTNYSLAAVRSYCGVGTATGTARITIGSGNADVSLYSVVNTRTPRVGEVVSYSITLRNEGPGDAQGVVLTDRLPTGLAFVDGSPGWQVGAQGVLTINAGTLLNGEEKTFFFRAQVNAAGVYINATEVSDSQTPDPDSQPGTGTADGQDDATQVDFRTADANGPLVASANPDQQLLPSVLPNQPTPVANMADLSLHMNSSLRVARAKQTLTLTLRVGNLGGRAASGVRIDVLFPNGSYLNASGSWVIIETPTLASYFVSSVSANSTVTLPVQWRPVADGDVVAEIAASAVADPDSTPNNRTTKPGEDDEASLSVRLR